MKEFYLNSWDDTPIYVTIWDDVNDPKGVIQVVHGMSEYAGRYDRFAKFLNSEGYIVFADDHRAMGRTETKENIGRHKGKIFEKTLKDEVFFREWLKTQYDLPIFYLGHSYGSFLGQAFAQAGTDCKAIALVGTGHMKALFTFAKIALAPIWLVAKNWRPKLVNHLSDNFIKFKGDSGKNQWINSVPEMRDTYNNGEFTHTDMSINFDFNMFRGTSKLYSRKALSKLNPATSIGLFCGGDDMVGGKKNKQVKKLKDMYDSLGVQCDMHIYKGARHEVIYDICEKEVCKDIANFFDKFIIYKQTSIDDLLG